MFGHINYSGAKKIKPGIVFFLFSGIINLITQGEKTVKNTVKVSRGEVVGIGKVKIPRTTEFSHEIPMLSFLVIQEADGKFISSCIHLRIDGYGSADDASVDNMIDGINSFLKANFTRLSDDDAWENLKDLCHIDDDTAELWNAYRDVQFNLAAMGVPTDSAESLRKKIAQMQRRIEQLETENAELKEELSLIVDYTPLRTAA